jgi:hypothetical protein
MADMERFRTKDWISSMASLLLFVSLYIEGVVNGVAAGFPGLDGLLLRIRSAHTTVALWLRVSMSTQDPNLHNTYNPLLSRSTA